MPELKKRDRGHTIPRVAWWCDAATEAVNASGMTRGELAEEIFRRFGYRTSEAKLIRTLRGDILTWDLAVLVSELLGLPRPLVEPSSMDEALHLLAQRELYRVRLQVRVLSAGVPESPPGGQSASVEIADGGLGKRKRRRVERTQGG